MFQVKYKPLLKDPVNYYIFCIKLFNATLKALKKSLENIKTEINILKNINEKFYKKEISNEKNIMK